MSHRRLILQADPRTLVMSRSVIKLKAITGGTFCLHRVTETVRYDGRKVTTFVKRVD